MAAAETAPLCLQLDVGNSAAKWRLVELGQPTHALARGRFIPGDMASQQAFINTVDAPTEIWVASVSSAERDTALADWLRDAWQLEPWFARTQAVSGDLVNSYKEPHRMGVDRWLAMVGARARRAGRLCVVDAGSALTIDIVAANGVHEGGYIIPGASLMERALLLDTDRVRFDQESGYALSAGNSTASAVRHGIALAQVGAVAQALAQLNAPSPSILFTGGGGEQLMNLGNFEGEMVPDLVLDGLDEMARQRRESPR